MIVLNYEMREKRMLDAFNFSFRGEKSIWVKKRKNIKDFFSLITRM